MEFTPPGKRCAFCGQPGGPDVELAGGLGAMTCDECVDHFHDNNMYLERVEAMSRPPWDAMPLTELLATLPLIVKSSEQKASTVQE